MNDLSQSSIFDLSIYQNSTYSFYDPLLTVNDDAIMCVGLDTKSDFMFKMLGRQLQWELTNTKIIEKL